MGKMVKFASLSWVVSVSIVTGVAGMAVLESGCGKPERRDDRYARSGQAGQRARTSQPGQMGQMGQAGQTWRAEQPSWQQQGQGQQARQTQRTCSADDDCGSGSLCVRSACAEITADMAECAMSRVQFETDSAELTAQAQDRLRRIARCIQANQPAQVIIEGNADRRGPEGYNYVLGDRRATSVANFLVQQGVSQDQLRTVSYGEANPLCWEQDQECLTKNRRAAVRTRGKQTAGRRKQTM
jgi:peptidoglycan-associated lipoprotein